MWPGVRRRGPASGGAAEAGRERRAIIGDNIQNGEYGRLIGMAAPGTFAWGRKSLQKKHLLIGLVASVCASAANAASKCSVKMIAELPVTMSGLRPLVHVKINDRDATFIADSGAWFSMISPGSAAEYDLVLEPLPRGFFLQGVGGSVAPMLTTVKKFTIVGVPIPRVQFLVGGSEFGSVGLLGQNVLALADTEFDLAHGVIRLMRNDGCSKVDMAYWAPAGAAYSELTTEVRQDLRPHIIAPVYINGVKLRALFDTGASTSFISLSAAARFGLKPNSPGVVAAGDSRGIGRRMVATWLGPVQSIKIGDEEIQNTRIRFGGTLEDVDMLLGADFFLSHRIYWSNKLRKMFFTFNGGHVFDLRYLHEDGDDEDSPPVAIAEQADAGPTPADGAGFSRRGAARASRGDLSGALADFDQAVKLDPSNIEFLRQRAELHARMRAPNKALEDLDRLIAAKSDDVDARLMRAGLRRSQDHKADVRGDVDAAAAAASRTSDRRLIIASIYADLGAYPQSIAQYDLWIAAHPDDSRRPMALNGRCWARALSGVDLALALKDCNAALSARPHTPSFLDSRGLVRVRMGDYAKAIADYDEVLAADDKIAWSFYGRGIAKLRLGQKEAGEADVKKAKELESELPEKAKKLGIAP